MIFTESNVTQEVPMTLIRNFRAIKASHRGRWIKPKYKKSVLDHDEEFEDNNFEDLFWASLYTSWVCVSATMESTILLTLLCITHLLWQLQEKIGDLKIRRKCRFAPSVGGSSIYLMLLIINWLNVCIMACMVIRSRVNSKMGGIFKPRSRPWCISSCD